MGWWVLAVVGNCLCDLVRKRSNFSTSSPIYHSRFTLPFFRIHRECTLRFFPVCISVPEDGPHYFILQNVWKWMRSTNNKIEKGAFHFFFLNTLLCKTAGVSRLSWKLVESADTSNGCGGFPLKNCGGDYLQI